MNRIRDGLEKLCVCVLLGWVVGVSTLPPIQLPKDGSAYLVISGLATHQNIVKHLSNAGHRRSRRSGENDGSDD